MKNQITNSFFQDWLFFFPCDTFSYRKKTYRAQLVGSLSQCLARKHQSNLRASGRRPRMNRESLTFQLQLRRPWITTKDPYAEEKKEAQEHRLSSIHYGALLKIQAVFASFSGSYAWRIHRFGVEIHAIFFRSLPMLRARLVPQTKGHVKKRDEVKAVAVSKAWASFTFGSERSRHPGSTPKPRLQMVSKVKRMKRSLQIYQNSFTGSFRQHRDQPVVELHLNYFMH